MSNTGDPKPWFHVATRDNGEGFDVQVSRERGPMIDRYHVRQVIGNRLVTESWSIARDEIDHARYIPCREFRVGIEAEGRLTIYIDSPGETRAMLDHPDIKHPRNWSKQLEIVELM